MALTYTQLDTLTTNATFLGRLRQAIAHHAEYYLYNSGSTAAQIQWCENVFAGGCAQKAVNMVLELIQDTTITSSTTGDASDVSDANLQTAVDKICEKY